MLEGGNKAGRFLEAATFGLGGRKGFIQIPEGRGGWAWLKFSCELRKAVDFLFVMASRRFGSSSSSDKMDGKEGSSLSLASKWSGPSFTEVLRSGLVTAVMESPTVGGRRSRVRASPAEPCALDLLLIVRIAEEDPKLAKDCSILEFSLLDLLDNIQPHRPLGKKLLPLSISKFKFMHVEQVGHRFQIGLGPSCEETSGSVSRV
jgi:hypothetical protein